MKTKETNLLPQSKDLLKYRFICDQQVQFGEAIYLTGNIDQLGNWKPQSSVKLMCYETKFWVLDVQVPIETDIEFKFFVSQFTEESEQTKSNVFPKLWIGNEEGENFKLFISKQEARLIELQRKTKDLKVMSFNIRSEKESDKNEFSWETRKFNCSRLIKEQFPSIVGIQEATANQRQYLQTSLRPYFSYVGANEMNSQNDQIGIFYNKQRFLLVQQGLRVISDQKLFGSTVEGTSKSNFFSFAVLEDTFNSERFIKTFHNGSSKNVSELPRELFLVENVYLDYHSPQSQKKGIELIREESKAKMTEYKDQIKDLFVIGDFNLPENSNMMHTLEKQDLKLESIRKNLVRKHMKESCDLSFTFHAFEHDQYDIENPQKTIDHMFVSTRDYEPMRFDVVRSLTQKVKSSKKQVISDHFPIVGVFKHKRNEFKPHHLKA